MKKIIFFSVLVISSSCGSLLSNSIEPEKTLTKSEKMSASPQSSSNSKKEEHSKSSVFDQENKMDTIKRLEVYE